MKSIKSSLNLCSVLTALILATSGLFSLPRGLFCIRSEYILQDNLRKGSLIKNERKIQHNEGVKMSVVKKK